ncbi:hypothetical protein T552_00696 [Pneumocystis carinii B80]|uniref:RNA polymerase II degradation factor 1 n=1 Tax=Pneumocystis carinii (strain B80) TaxID=1408658 RepID=A0A0W4ZPD1_PNEC8|nr:hypothetical protein T552_00696 [Pneumocystis carinii B80]KTW30218.1 hypothetical protein T552_00696 [Pneumocystis carinii B80]
MIEVQQLQKKRSRKEFRQTHPRRSQHHETQETYKTQVNMEKSSQENAEEVSTNALSLESAMLKTQYHRQLMSCKELFPDWTEEDILYAIQEASGDFEVAVTRISEGRANKWGEVKKKTKDKGKKQDALQSSTLLTGSGKSSRDKIRDPKNHKNKENISKRGGGRSNGISKRNHQTVSDSSLVTWDTVKNVESRTVSIDTTGTGSNIKTSWTSYKQPKDSLGQCLNLKKNINKNIEYGVKETENAIWEDFNPINQDSRSISAWSDAATKASSVTAGWGESGSFYMSNAESQNSSSSKPRTKVISPGTNPSWASLLKQESIPDIQEQQLSPISRASFRSDENFSNTFPVSKLTEKKDHGIINGVNHVPIVSKTSLTTLNLESINKENIDHVISLKNPKNSINIANQTLNNTARFHEFNKSHSSKSTYHRHLSQDTPVVMPNSNNISERVEVQFGSLNLAGQENGLFLNREKSKPELNSVSQGISMNLHSPIGPALQQSQSIENSEPTDIQKTEKMYTESSNTTQPHILPNRTAMFSLNLNKVNKQLSEQKQVQYQPFDQNSYNNYTNHPIRDNIPNFGNFSLPNEYQRFYGSEDPRPHFAQGYYDPSAFSRGQPSNTSMHRDASNINNEYIQTSRFDPNALEGSSIPSQQMTSGSIMHKHMPIGPNTLSQSHSSTQGHFHQAQPYPIHPYYNPYTAYYVNQYGYGNYPYTKQNIYNHLQQDYSRSYNENSFTNSDNAKKFNEHPRDLSQSTNQGKPQDYAASKSQNSNTSQQQQWPQQKNISNNSLEYTGKKSNTTTHQSNYIQHMQKFHQQNPVRPIYPGSSHTYPPHFQQPSHPQPPSTQSSSIQTQPSPYSMHPHTIGFHGPYQPLLNPQDHPNLNWTNYTSH